MGEAYSFLWAEAKAGVKKDMYESFVQLILTIGKERTFEAINCRVLDGYLCCRSGWLKKIEILAKLNKKRPRTEDTRTFRSRAGTGLISQP